MPEHHFRVHREGRSLRLEPTRELPDNPADLFRVALGVAGMLGQMGYAPVEAAGLSEFASDPAQFLSGSALIPWAMSPHEDPVDDDDDDDDDGGGGGGGDFDCNADGPDCPRGTIPTGTCVYNPDDGVTVCTWYCAGVA